jgi:hypothetical protein
MGHTLAVAAALVTFAELFAESSMTRTVLARKSCWTRCCVSMLTCPRIAVVRSEQRFAMLLAAISVPYPAKVCFPRRKGSARFNRKHSNALSRSTF